MTKSPSRQAVDVLLLRGRGTSPQAARPADVAVPWWVPVLIAVSGALLVAGAIRTTGSSHASHPGLSGAHFTVAKLLVLTVGGGAGRLFAVLVQAQSAISLGGWQARDRASRRTVIAVSFIAQVPMVLGDLVICLLAMTGGLGLKSFVSLEASPFNPLVLWSCFIFARGLKSFPELFDNAARRKMLVGFGGYLYLIKLAIFGLTLAG